MSVLERCVNNAKLQRQSKRRFWTNEAGVNLQGYSDHSPTARSIEGTTDLGLSVRVGVRFLLMTRGATTSSAATGNVKWSSFLFLEAQHISAEVDDIDLGGEAYSLGFRMEFNPE